MTKDRPGPLSDVSDEDGSPSLWGLYGPKVLDSLTAETLGELARSLLIVGAVLAALVVWAFGDWLAPRAARWIVGCDGFVIGWASSVLEGPIARDALVRSHIGLYTRETAVVFGLLGGLFGLLGGASGGLVTRSIPRTAKAGAGGLILGSVVCGAACFVVVPIYLALILQAPDTWTSIGAHALIESSAAAACGFVIGIAARAGVKESLRLVAAGVMGASLGALIFGFVQMFYFPFESEFIPIPRSSLCRLTEFACATFVPAVCIAVILKTPSTEEADGEHEEAAG
jgi:hypothetical protein